MATKAKLSGKNRKYGRQERSPAHMRYNNEERWDKNKLRRAKHLAKKFDKPIMIKQRREWVKVA
jgi:hypothetical protein